jgi:hypothetical protein
MTLQTDISATAVRRISAPRPKPARTYDELAAKTRSLRRDLSATRERLLDAYARIATLEAEAQRRAAKAGAR